MANRAIAKTNSRFHLGTLNDFSFMLRYQLHGQTDLDLVQTALELAHTPVGPLRPTHFPDRLTRQLLEGWRTRRGSMASARCRSLYSSTCTLPLSVATTRFVDLWTVSANCVPPLSCTYLPINTNA